MKTRRIQVIGAPGSGTTTLGRALASRIAASHHDSDDFYWRPTNPPYREKRPLEDRIRLMHEMFAERPGWVLSGSVEGWGDDILPDTDLIVYIDTPTETRIQRLHRREIVQFGKDAIAEGGWRHEESSWFVEWASHYEDGTREGRSRQRHETWLASQTCSILHLDGTRTTDELVDEIVTALP